MYVGQHMDEKNEKATLSTSTHTAPTSLTHLAELRIRPSGPSAIWLQRAQYLVGVTSSIPAVFIVGDALFELSFSVIADFFWTYMIVMLVSVAPFQYLLKRRKKALLQTASILLEHTRMKLGSDDESYLRLQHLMNSIMEPTSIENLEEHVESDVVKQTELEACMEYTLETLHRERIPSSYK